MTGQAIAHIAKLRTLEGKTRAEAAEALGLCEAYVVRLAKDNDVFLGKKPSPTRALVERLRPLAAAGFTMQEAASDIGVSYVYVAQLSAKHDIKFIRSGLALEPTIREQQMAAHWNCHRNPNPSLELAEVTTGAASRHRRQHRGQG